MRILTWNVNGLATTLQYHPWHETKSYKVLLDTLEADIICFQEVKCQRSKMTREMALVPGYDAYFSFSKVKLGYSGVCVYVKEGIPKPKKTGEGITGILDKHDNEELRDFLTTLKTPAETLDAEGRCIILDFQSVILFNIYFPNFASEERQSFIIDYYACVRKRIDMYLKEGRDVVLVGDVNAVHEELDHCDPKESIKNNNLSDFKDLPNRRWLDALIAPRGPLVDTTRYHHPARKGMFTCWNTRLNARPANFGTRIDYILVSQRIQHTNADIQPGIVGSDHCPVYADLDLQLKDPFPLEPSVLLTSQWTEFSSKQKKLFNYFTVNTQKRESTVKCVKENNKKRKEMEPVEREVKGKQTDAWSTLFQPREIPKCAGHNEICLERTVTKKGQNLGRIFYVCSKPVGPQEGPKDQVSCNHFSWKQQKKKQ